MYRDVSKMAAKIALVCTLLIAFWWLVGGLEATVCINAEANQPVQIEGASA